MQIAMSPKERTLLESFLCRTSNYFEFGTGGSTWLASQLVCGSVISVDSSEEWLQKVRLSCEGHAIKPVLRFIDIGPLKDWGAPATADKRSNWPQYSGAATSDADFYLVDGRFRVASFAQCLISAPPSAMIGIHDFEVRPEYHVVRTVAREVAKAENLSVFVKDQSANLEAAEKLRIKYLYDYF